MKDLVEWFNIGVNFVNSVSDVNSFLFKKKKTSNQTGTDIYRNMERFANVVGFFNFLVNLEICINTSGLCHCTRFEELY